MKQYLHISSVLYAMGKLYPFYHRFWKDACKRTGIALEISITMSRTIVWKYEVVFYMYNVLRMIEEMHEFMWSFHIRTSIIGYK